MESAPAPPEPLRLIDVPCALCGAGDAPAFLSGHDAQGVTPGVFTLARCRGCGLVFLNPRPADDQLSLLYREEKFDFYSGGTSGHAPARAAVVEQFAPGRRLLDVGSGDGSFLRHIAARGWQVAGVEMHEQAARRQREEFGLDVRTGTLEQAALPAGAFDVITYWDVFEHIPDPVAELAEAHRLLAPGGIIIFSLPNIASIEAKVFGARWYRLQLPRHLYHYSPRTLGRMAARAGLRLKAARCATTATGVLNSLRPERAANSSVANAPENTEGSGDREQGTAKNNQMTTDNRQQTTVINVAETQPHARTAFLKKAVFNLALVPALKAIDALRLGGHFIAVAEKTKDVIRDS